MGLLLQTSVLTRARSSGAALISILAAPQKMPELSMQSEAAGHPEATPQLIWGETFLEGRAGNECTH